MCRNWDQHRNSKELEISEAIRKVVSKASYVDAMITNSIPRGHVREVDGHGTVSPEVAARWASLTDEDRLAIIEQLVEERAKESGIDRPPIAWNRKLRLDGRWSEGTTVELDPDLLDDPKVLYTVVHEVRHARQDEVVRDMNDLTWPWEDDPFDEHEEDGITLNQAEEWEEEDYTPLEEDFEKYWNQPSEVDARDAGRKYVEDELTEKELDRLLKGGQQPRRTATQ